MCGGGGVYFRGRLCGVHLKMSFVAAEKKGERDETRRRTSEVNKTDSKISQKRERSRMRE